MTMLTRVFVSGNSQAVRIPKSLRTDASEMTIRREGEALILEPVARKKWPAGFFRKIAIPSMKRPPQGETPEPPAFD